MRSRLSRMGIQVVIRRGRGPPRVYLIGNVIEMPYIVPAGRTPFPRGKFTPQRCLAPFTRPLCRASLPPFAAAKGSSQTSKPGSVRRFAPLKNEAISTR